MNKVANKKCILYSKIVDLMILSQIIKGIF